MFVAFVLFCLCRLCYVRLFASLSMVCVCFAVLRLFVCFRCVVLFCFVVLFVSDLLCCFVLVCCFVLFFGLSSSRVSDCCVFCCFVWSFVFVFVLLGLVCF